MAKFSFIHPEFQMHFRKTFRKTILRFETCWKTTFCENQDKFEVVMCIEVFEVFPKADFDALWHCVISS